MVSPERSEPLSEHVVAVHHEVVQETRSFRWILGVLSLRNDPVRNVRAERECSGISYPRRKGRRLAHVEGPRERGRVITSVRIVCCCKTSDSSLHPPPFPPSLLTSSHLFSLPLPTPSVSLFCSDCLMSGAKVEKCRKVNGSAGTAVTLGFKVVA